MLAHLLWLLEERVEREVRVARQREVLEREGEHVLRTLLLVGRLGQLLEAEADVQDAVDEHQVRFLSYLQHFISHFCSTKSKSPVKIRCFNGNLNNSL